MNLAMEQGWFKKDGMTPYESVHKSDFEDFTRLVSAHNATH